ncbi:MAG: VWA domain-containing protein [Chitinophagales bacterium]|nr:VWA domain-containing protein [Chitinophagales bacterium]MBP8754523.1 VWA domain-containing protein [Chitinophagales bacterium]MBP9549745.1 VWA domain-containing protein [Chitinophagales bacterium]MBP9795017.1 VWA domain-containing protein [Chitinophagales bacterium]
MNFDLAHITFADPWFLLLLILIPVFILYQHNSKKKFVVFNSSTIHNIKEKLYTPRTNWIKILPALRMLSFAFAVIALARPQAGFSNKKITTEGIDIVLAMDISSSMYAIDFKPNRMTAAKEAAKNFVRERRSDRIGLVVFAGEAFTQCPITLDHILLENQIDIVDNWQLEDGTAIGDGLFMAVNRLRDTTQLSTKVIILLTDGVRTAGEFSPQDAAYAAAQLNIRVYTIGVGSETTSPIPVVDKSGRMIFELDPRISFDEPSLKEIAEITGGLYFRATSKEKLTEIYKEIDKIERQKVEVNVTKRYEEKFYLFAVLAFVCLLLEMMLSKTIFRTLT